MMWGERKKVLTQRKARSVDKGEPHCVAKSIWTPEHCTNMVVGHLNPKPSRFVFAEQPSTKLWRLALLS